MHKGLDFCVVTRGKRDRVGADEAIQDVGVVKRERSTRNEDDTAGTKGDDNNDEISKEQMRSKTELLFVSTAGNLGDQISGNGASESSQQKGFELGSSYDPVALSRVRSESSASALSDISPTSADQSSRRGNKRMKTLTPIDRKAYYSIISLLIDRSAIPSNETVTIDNFESFIPTDRIVCLDKLKDFLNYDC